MTRTPDFLESELNRRDPGQSLFHVIPIPLEASVSYGGGTARGPDAILHASCQLEGWDGRSRPLLKGIHTTPPVDCTGPVEAVLDRIQARTEKSLSMGAVPVGIGGEHSLTLGLLRALKLHGDFGVVQFDAHADLRDEYEGDPFSHACVMRRTVEELDLPVFQIGVRAMSFEERRFRSRRGIGRLDARTLHENGIPDLLLPDDFPGRIYISFDVDGLDPSVIRATGAPVPGGPGWRDCLALVEKSLENRELAGFDVVELAPTAGDHASDFAAALLVYSIMGMAERNRGGRPPG